MFSFNLDQLCSQSHTARIVQPVIKFFEYYIFINMMKNFCCSEQATLPNKVSTAQLFDNMASDIEQLLAKVRLLDI